MSRAAAWIGGALLLALAGLAAVLWGAWRAVVNVPRVLLWLLQTLWLLAVLGVVLYVALYALRHLS